MIIRSLLSCCLTAVLLGATASAHATEPAAPITRVHPRVAVFEGGWPDRLPPRGSVNAPNFLETLSPGQTIRFGLIAQGPERDTLLRGATGRLTIRLLPGSAQETFEFRSGTIRALKAQGADAALVALSAAGISDAEREKLRAATVLTSLAISTTSWTVPDTPEITEVELLLELSGDLAGAPIPPSPLPIKSTPAWLQSPAPTPEALAQTMNRYRGDLSPGEYLARLRSLAATPALNARSVRSFLVHRLRSDPATRAATVASFPILDARTQDAALLLLRLAGEDLRTLFPTLPESQLAKFTATTPLAPPVLSPGFRDPVQPQAVKELGNIMDDCWGAWMATGETRHLRALVDLLAHQADFAEFETWQKRRGGEKGLNARVANGLAYQIAGWSIGSFQRTDPLVADWLAYWQDDPETPEAIRRELKSLPLNPAFRRR